MAIASILEKFVDARKNGKSCDFNGYLEDYLQMIDENSQEHRILSAIFEQNNDAKILVNYHVGINASAITNQIIRYKDVNKLEEDALTVPYIIYEAKDNTERALIYYPDCECGYVFAKGLYYCLTEPGSELIDYRNEFIAISGSDEKLIADTYNAMFKKKAGFIQRDLDSKFYPTYEDMKQAVIARSNAMHENVFEELKDVEDKYPIIKDHIIKWFLFKKVLYVQYMLNKDILQKVHEGNVKKQRNQAKMNADEIVFVSFSSMWRGHEQSLAIADDFFY